MGKITSTSELKTTIILLSQKQDEDERLLKEQLLLVADSLKPVNIIKSTIQHVSNSTDIKSTLINSSLSLAAGYFSKKIVEGDHPNSLQKTLGVLLQIGISSLFSNQSKNIKSGLAQVINLFSNKKETEE